jgi:hypothetical protein
MGSEDPRGDPEEKPRPDRLFALGMALFLGGVAAAGIGWLARPEPGMRWLPLAGAAAAVLGLPLLALRASGMRRQELVGQLRVEQNPTASSQMAHAGVIVGSVAFLAAGGLVLVALRAGNTSPGFNPSWLAAILWAMLGAMSAVGTVAIAFRSRWLSSGLAAASLALAVLCALGGLAFAYFRLLDLPGPEMPPEKHILWIALAWGFILLLRVFRWWKDLKKGIGPSGQSAGDEGPGTGT